MRVRHGRGQHEEARNSDVVEGVISGAMRPLTCAVEPGNGLDGGLHVGLGLRHPRHIFESCGPAAARAVAIDLRDTVLVEVDGKGVRVPSRAGIAPSRMPGPPSDAY